MEGCIITSFKRFFTKQGLPYAIDGSVLKSQTELITHFGKIAKSSENWAMMNGFEFIGGGSSLFFSVLEAKNLSQGYLNDLAFSTDGLFAFLNVAGGIATANPLLVIIGFVKGTSIYCKTKMKCRERIKSLL